MGRRGFGRSSGQYTPYTWIQTLSKIAHIDVFPSGGNNTFFFTLSDFVLPHFRKSISQPAPKAMSTIDLRQTSRSSLGFNILKVIRPPLPQMGHIVPLTSQTMFRTKHEGIWGAKCRSSDNNFLFIYLFINQWWRSMTTLLPWLLTANSYFCTAAESFQRWRGTFTMCKGLRTRHTFRLWFLQSKCSYWESPLECTTLWARPFF